MDSTLRFTGRVENYAKYRPGYPRPLVHLMRATATLHPGATIADVGCGTGKLAGILLEAGFRVVGVEPNDAMRAAAEQVLGRFPAFQSSAGRAEATTLADQSVHAIVAGQAFHWFDAPRARVEFARILKPEGWVWLVWNNRKPDATPFMVEYESLLRRHCPEYDAIAATHGDERSIAAFFHPAPVHRATLANRQTLDRDGVRGRLLSSSYVPSEGPACQALLHEMDEAFTRHEREGLVSYEYDTVVFYGRLT